MIPDWQTNRLYLADKLPVIHPAFFHSFQNLLHQNDIPFHLLPATKDVWAVDYMPIQIDADRFVQFIYNPGYLQTTKRRKTISDSSVICNYIGLPVTKSTIVLDGGNLVKATNKVIMTERVFKENPTVKPKKLVKVLHDILEVDNIFFVPEQPNDFTGHADRMLRFIDDETIIINDYAKEKQSFQKAFTGTKTTTRHREITLIIYRWKTWLLCLFSDFEKTMKL